MSVISRWWQRDLFLRTSGVASVLFAILAMQHLTGLVHRAPRHEATVTEMGLAAVGFLGSSLGGALTFLGAQIHDKVQTSERWRTRQITRPALNQARSEEPFTRSTLQASEQASQAPQFTSGLWLQR